MQPKDHAANTTSSFMPSTQGYASGITISHWVYAAQNIGIDLKDELERNGLLSPADYEPLSRIDGQRYEKILMSLLLASGDGLFGLHIGQQLLLARYGLMVPTLLQSHTVEQAILTIERYQELASNMGVLTFSREKEKGKIEWRVLHENPVLRHHTTDCFFAMLMQAIRLTTSNQRMAPERIDFILEPPSLSQRKEMEQFFRCPIRFSQPQDAVILPGNLLTTTVNPFDQELAISLESELVRQLSVLQEQDTLLGQIKHQLRLSMQRSLPRRQQVADSMGISIRTLDRRMANEGISWQELLDTTRASMARELLMQTTLSMTEISRRLGFSDVRSFQRRFRHWSGMAPSDFRLNHQN
jgi:AraC-like DNA-binding protein